MDVIIDTQGQTDLRKKDRLIESDDDLDFEDNGTDFAEIFKPVEEKVMRRIKVNTSKDVDLEEFERHMGWKYLKKDYHKKAIDVSVITKEITPIDKVLENSVIKPGFEQLEVVPPYNETKKQIQAQRHKERAKTKGKQWFNLPATEMTPEVRRDLELIQMRSVLDPKHFYKKNDLKILPKYFQIGKVIDSPYDYYSGRLTKKERKKSIVDELMADAEFAKYNKRKYKEIIDKKKKSHYKAYMHAKKLKNKKN
ncbi:hypothetical protein KM043_017058 [Ampulex compressa]|nr:hypothetical protein KM043_017058 [Ampulex compressa]